MANGDQFTSNAFGLGYKLLDAQSATITTAPYVDCRSIGLKTIEVDGAESGSTINIEGRNDDTQPGTGTAGAIVGTVAGTGNPVKIEMQFSYRWIRASKTQGGSPTATTCYMWALYQWVLG